MKLDILNIHDNTIIGVCGEFYGTPIYVWSEKTAIENEVHDTKDRIKMSDPNRQLPTEITSLLKTGQFVISKDHCIRNVSADTHNENPTGIRDLHQRSYDFVHQEEITE